MSAPAKPYKKSFKKRKVGASGQPSKALVAAVAKQIERKEETKYGDDAEWNQETIDDYTAPSLLASILNVAQGNTFETRVGNKIFVDRILVKCRFSTSVSQAYPGVSIAVVEDLEPSARGGDSAATLWDKVFKNTGAAVTNIMALPRPGYNSRFRVRKFMYLPLNPGGSYYDTGAANPRWTPATRHVTLKIPINKVISYADGTTNPPVGGCGIYVFAWSDTNSNTTKVDAVSRVYFRDA